MMNCNANCIRRATWNDTRFSTLQARLTAVFMLLVVFCLIPEPTAAAMKLLSPSVGWVTSQAHLYWTVDVGDQWMDITPALPGVPRASLGGVFFRNVSEGWAILSYQEPSGSRPSPSGVYETKAVYSIAHTTDSGASWSLRR
jgi:hypothetical protein